MRIQTRGSQGPAPAQAADPAWAWAAYQPDTARPWDARRVGHLYRRAAFGASPAQTRQALSSGPGVAVDRLMRPDEAALSLNRTFDSYERHAIDRDAPGVETLREWWLRRMMQTCHPLLEVMTLFWHDHFAVSNGRVKSGWLMAHHIQKLRDGALGKLEPLLASLVRDPALLLSHHAGASRKGAPEMSLARAWLDRFTLGPARATAGDVTEAARAFTGRFVLRNEFRALDHEHDSGSKTVLGSEGHWTDADVVRITAAHPATSLHLTRRLYRWFVSDADEPTDAFLAPLADGLARDGDLGRLVETILRSNQFFSGTAYRAKIKSPVGLAVGIVRGFDGVVPSTPLANDLADLGQNLGQPPTSAGWPGGTAWLNRGTAVGRANLASALMTGDGSYAGKLNLEETFSASGRSPEVAAGAMLDLLLDGDVPAGTRRHVLQSVAASKGDSSRALRDAARVVATLPEFQLA